MPDTSLPLHMDANGAETLRLLISTAIAAQHKREQASAQGNIRYRPDPKKIEEEEEEGEEVKS
ncbi:Peptidase M13neprilysin [Penicillium desertorum]|uniref:Peptidase M13neprilysin n=1 Tax=Penicillium desertorum TaxID=1303715 RepID=A0A9W9XA09_9EURO|nr:Peptidase M13neprilysin [Penicillium desertorum]